MHSAHWLLYSVYRFGINAQAHRLGFGFFGIESTSSISYQANLMSIDTMTHNDTQWHTMIHKQFMPYCVYGDGVGVYANMRVECIRIYSIEFDWTFELEIICINSRIHQQNIPNACEIRCVSLMRSDDCECFGNVLLMCFFSFNCGTRSLLYCLFAALSRISKRKWERERERATKCSRPCQLSLIWIVRAFHPGPTKPTQRAN